MKNILIIILGLVIFACERELEIPEIVLNITPRYGDKATLFVFEAENSLYFERSLKYRWDFDSDGIFDKESNSENQVVSKALYPGWNSATVEVTLRNGVTQTETSNFLVLTSNPDTSFFIDPRDHKEYKTVKINDRWWFAENLQYGHIITTASSCTDNSIPEVYAWKNELKYYNEYGGLYSWFELMEYSSVEKARGLCPDGWHVPSSEEWLELVVDSLPMQIVWNCIRNNGYWNLNLISGLKHRLDEELWHDLPEINSSIAPFSVSYWTSSFEIITVPQIRGPFPYEGRLPYEGDGFQVISNGFDTEEAKIDPFNFLFPVRCTRDE